LRLVRGHPRAAEERAAEEEERIRLHYAKMGDNYIVPHDPKKTDASIQ
jgi:hypothetical protein